MSLIKRSFVVAVVLFAVALLGFGPQHALAAPTCTLTVTHGTLSSGAAPVPYVRIDWKTTDATTFSITGGFGQVSPVSSGYRISFNDVNANYIGTATASDGSTATCDSSTPPPGAPPPPSDGEVQPPPPPPPAPGCISAGITHYLYFGKTDADTGGDVTKLQIFFKSVGLLDAAAPLGYYGPMTQEAVQAFQRNNNIVSSGTPDTTGYGAVGPRTLTAINAACGSNPTAAAGACGTTAYTCTAGTVTNQGTSGNSSIWTCAGTTSSAQCSASTPIGGGGNDGVVSDPTAPPAVYLKETGMLKAGRPTLNIKNLPSEFTIEPGAPVGLTWRTAGAQHCTASGDWSGDQATSSSATLAPLLESAAYTLTCTNSYGSAKSTLILNVRGQPPYSSTHVINQPVSVPTSIDGFGVINQYFAGVALRELTTGSTSATLPPGPVTLYWQTKNATNCRASGAWSGAVRDTLVTTNAGDPAHPVGSITIPNVTSSGVYTITCENRARIYTPGVEVSASVTINISGTPRATAPIERPSIDLYAVTGQYPDRDTSDGTVTPHEDIVTVLPNTQGSSYSYLKKGLAWTVTSPAPLTACTKSATGGAWTGPADLAKSLTIDGFTHRYTYKLSAGTLSGYNTYYYPSVDQNAFSNLVDGAQYLFNLACANSGGSTSDSVLVASGGTGPAISSITGGYTDVRNGSRISVDSRMTLTAVGRNFTSATKIVVGPNTTTPVIITPSAFTSTTLTFKIPTSVTPGNQQLQAVNDANSKDTWCVNGHTENCGGTVLVIVTSTPTGPPTLTQLVQSPGSTGLFVGSGTNFESPMAVQIDFDKSNALQLMVAPRSGNTFILEGTIPAGTHSARVHTSLGDSNTVTLVVTGAGQPATDGSTAPPVITFSVNGTAGTASPPIVTAPAGTQLQVKWSAGGTNNCTASGGWLTNQADVLTKTSATYTVGNTSQVLSLYCSNGSGSSYKGVQVKPGTSTTATGGGGSDGTAQAGVCGSSTNTCGGGVSPLSVNSSTHTWVCAGTNGGSNTTCPSTNSGGSVLGCALTGPTSPIAAGGSAMFTWTTTGAASSFSIENITSTSAADSPGTVTPASGGSKTITVPSPTTQTTYTYRGQVKDASGAGYYCSTHVTVLAASGGNVGTCTPGAGGAPAICNSAVTTTGGVKVTITGAGFTSSSYVVLVRTGLFSSFVAPITITNAQILAQTGGATNITPTSVTFTLPELPTGTYLLSIGSPPAATRSNSINLLVTASSGSGTTTTALVAPTNLMCSQTITGDPPPITLSLWKKVKDINGVLTDDPNGNIWYYVGHTYNGTDAFSCFGVWDAQLAITHPENAWISGAGHKYADGREYRGAVDFADTNPKYMIPYPTCGQNGHGESGGCYGGCSLPGGWCPANAHYNADGTPDLYTPSGWVSFRDSAESIVGSLLNPVNVNNILGMPYLNFAKGSRAVQIFDNIAKDALGFIGKTIVLGPLGTVKTDRLRDLWLVSRNLATSITGLNNPGQFFLGPASAALHGGGLRQISSSFTQMVLGGQTPGGGRLYLIPGSEIGDITDAVHLGFDQQRLIFGDVAHGMFVGPLDAFTNVSNASSSPNLVGDNSTN